MEFWQTSSSGTSPCSPSRSTKPAATACGPGSGRAGCRQACTSTRGISGISTGAPGPIEWIASQRDSLARIFHAPAVEQVLGGGAAGSSGRCSGQLTLPGLGSFSSKIRPGSGNSDARKLSRNSWRVDIPGETEPLPRLMSAPRTGGAGGGSLLPTLTVCGNWNRAGASPTSGNGLATALRLLPTICATDYKELYSEAGYRRQMQRRSKPLRDTLVHITGHRLTPAFAEWWMGWPINWTATRRWPASTPAATARCRSRRPRRG